MAGLGDLSDDNWDRMCAVALGQGGHLILEKAPVQFKKKHDVFGLSRPEWPVMHRIKAALDPQNVFAPGRLPGR
jgi:FAD/FMN-containing dehydrogenase